jgi:hypothetical protein
MGIRLCWWAMNKYRPLIVFLIDSALFALILLGVLFALGLR